MRQALIVAGACAVGLCAVRAGGAPQRPSAEAGSCGRPATQAVAYWGHSAELPAFAITYAGIEGGAFAVYAEGPGQNSLSRRGSGYADWKTLDLGATWTATKPVVYGPAGYFRWGTGSALSDSRVMYTSGGYRQDVFERSVDAGRNWESVTPTIDGVSAAQFALSRWRTTASQAALDLRGIDPTDPMTVYASVAVYAPSDIPTLPETRSVPGIYVSHDGGDSWRKLTEALSSNQLLGPIGICPLDPRIMYGLADGSIALKSVDGGHHWVRVGQFEALRAPVSVALWLQGRVSYIKGRGYLNPAIQWVFDPTNKNLLYFVSNKGVYRTSDGGATWRLLDLGFDEIRGIGDLVINPLRPEQVFVAAEDFGIFRSNDRGCHFVDVTPAGASHRPLPPPLPAPRR